MMITLHEMSQYLACTACGNTRELPDQSPRDQSPCEVCDGADWHGHIGVTSQMSVHSGLLDEKLKLRGGREIDIRYDHQKDRENGHDMDRVQVVNRSGRWYTKFVRDLDTGDVKRDCSHPLRDKVRCWQCRRRHTYHAGGRGHPV